MSYRNDNVNTINSITVTPASLNIVNGDFVYQQQQGYPADTKLELTQLQVTNSFQNVGTLATPITYNNGMTGVTFTFAPGTYNYTDVNNTLQQALITNGQYLLSNLGQPVTFASITYLPNYNDVVVTTIPVPVTGALTGAYSGYTNPQNLVLSGLSPTINFGSLGNQLGLTGTYPLSATGVTQNTTGYTGTLNLGQVLLRSSLSSDSGLGNSQTDVIASVYVGALDTARQKYVLEPQHPKRLVLTQGTNKTTFSWIGSNGGQKVLPDQSSIYMEFRTTKN